MNILKKSNIDPAFKEKKATGTARNKKSAAQCGEILKTHSDKNALQTFQHVVKTNRSINYSELNCKTPIMIEDRCAKLDESLSVPLGKKYAVKKLFFFFPKRLCLTRPSVWSNILITHPLTIIIGDNISNEEHERLMVDMKNNY